MSSLSELVRDRTSLTPADAERLHRLLEWWELIADLSFADLLLWCPLVEEEGFVCVAQMRPHTAQTLHPEDFFGVILRPHEMPTVDRAFLEKRRWRQDEPVLIDGLQVRMVATPVPSEGRVIAVMTKEGAPLVHRRPGRLEETYLECAEQLDMMIECGFFPFAVEGLDPELSPRVGDGLVRVDSGGMVMYASPNATSAYRRLGIVSSIVDEPFSALGVDATPMLSALERGLPAEGEAASGDTIVLQRAIPFIAPNRRVEGAMILVRDVTELRHRERMLQRKEAAIREIHHRVKNNLQTIASLLRIQARRLEAPDVKRELEEAVKRIQAIAVVHETLTREGGEAVEFAPVVRKLVDMVSAGLIDSARTIQISVEGEAGRLPTELATPLAVVLVELIQNAVQHAFDDDGGKVRVRMWREEERVRLEVADDGRGLPGGFRLEDGGVGFQIVRALVTGELEGSIRLESDGGTTVGMDLPLSRARR